MLVPPTFLLKKIGYQKTKDGSCYSCEFTGVDNGGGPSGGETWLNGDSKSDTFCTTFCGAGRPCTDPCQQKCGCSAPSPPQQAVQCPLGSCTSYADCDGGFGYCNNCPVPWGGADNFVQCCGTGGGSSGCDGVAGGGASAPAPPSPTNKVTLAPLPVNAGPCTTTSGRCTGTAGCSCSNGFMKETFTATDDSQCWACSTDPYSGGQMAAACPPQDIMCGTCVSQCKCGNSCSLKACQDCAAQARQRRGDTITLEIASKSRGARGVAVNNKN